MKNSSKYKTIAIHFGGFFIKKESNCWGWSNRTTGKATAFHVVDLSPMAPSPAWYDLKTKYIEVDKILNLCLPK